MKAKKKHQFGKALVMARLRLGLAMEKEITGIWAAKQLGVSPGWLNLLENGHRHPNIEMLDKFLKLYPQSKKELCEALLGLEEESK